MRVAAARKVEFRVGSYELLSRSLCAVSLVLALCVGACGEPSPGEPSASQGSAQVATQPDVASTTPATPPPASLTLSITGSGTGSVASSPAGLSCSAGSSGCTGAFTKGDALALTAIAAAGSSFGGWKDSTRQCLGTETCAFTLADAQSISAVFVANNAPRYRLGVLVAGAGSVIGNSAGINCGTVCESSYGQGTMVALTGRATAGNVFAGWSGGDCAGIDACAVEMLAATSVTATFERAAATFALNVSVVGSGRVTSASVPIDCGVTCSAVVASGSDLTLAVTADAGHQFKGWSGACSGAAACTVSMSQRQSVAAVFAPLTGSGFAARPFLFKSVESRLRASIAANDMVATGASANRVGTPLGFLNLARAAAADRANFNDIPTFQIAFAGWLLNDTTMLALARDEAMRIVASFPNGDTGTGENFQHVEDRMLDVAATADLAFSQFSAGQLSQVANWVNGTLNNWNNQNVRFWPFDSPKNNYWQNGFLAHVVGAVASEGFNPQAASWRAASTVMAQKFKTATSAPLWNGPVQSEGHYYAGYVKNAVWAMELYDAALGTDWLAQSGFSFAQSLNLLMYQTRPHLEKFFEVGSEASNSDAPFTQLSLVHWHHMIHSGKSSSEAQHAKSILTTAMAVSNWSRASKGFANFYWNLNAATASPAAAKPDRFFVAPTPGAGLLGLRSSEGFQTNARAAFMFANRANSSADYSHANPDAPGFQWASGADWLVTDPEFFANSGILAEAGTNVGSDVSNIVTLAGQKTSETGDFPIIRFSEYNPSAAVPHSYIQIDARPYWTSSSVYRRDYVWLDDLQVVVVFDRIVGSPAKTWRLHIPSAPVINGNIALYNVNGKSVAVRDLYSTGGAGWSSTNLNGSIANRDVWRLSQPDSSNDYRSVKVLDVGGRVATASSSTGAGYVEVSLTIAGNVRVVRFFDDGRHASLR